MEAIGLDNGIIIRRRNGSNIKIPKYITESGYISGNRRLYEVAYWRRYWNLRGDILDAIGPRAEVKLEGYGNVIPVLAEDLIKIYSVVRNCYSSPSNFRASCNDCWWWGYWHYFKFNIWVGIKYLRNIKWTIKHFNDVEVFFYDSF